VEVKGKRERDGERSRMGQGREGELGRVVLVGKGEKKKDLSLLII
jgi:hypothetical protein